MSGIWQFGVEFVEPVWCRGYTYCTPSFIIVKSCLIINSVLFEKKNPIPADCFLLLRRLSVGPWAQRSPDGTGLLAKTRFSEQSNIVQGRSLKAFESWDKLTGVGE
jgi:hypothetical protein